MSKSICLSTWQGPLAAAILMAEGGEQDIAKLNK